MRFKSQKNFRNGALFTACLAAVSSAWPCVLELQRAQLAVIGRFETAAGQLPQEVELRVGDLVSVLAPRTAKVQLIAPDEKPQVSLKVLTPARYEELSSRYRASIPPEVMALGYPRSLQWYHFGADVPGVSYLKLGAGKDRALLRVSIIPRPVVPRGTELLWTEARQTDVVELTPYDTLALELPGEPGSGWKIAMKSGKASLRSVTQVQAADGSFQPRAYLRLVVEPEGQEDELVVQRDGVQFFRFLLRQKPVPIC